MCCPARYSRALVAIVGTMSLTQAAIAHGQPATQVAAAPETEAVVAPPPYKQLRYEEDYTHLRDRARRTDAFDPVKYVPFGGVEGRVPLHWRRGAALSRVVSERGVGLGSR